MSDIDSIRTKRTNISFIRMEQPMTAHGEQRVFIPEHADEAARVYEFLQAHSEPLYILGGTSERDRIEIPSELCEILRNVATVMSKGRAVNVEPFGLRLTTQEAAEFLNISRPTLIRLLEQGSIPFERVGKHRKVLLADVVKYQQARYEEIQESLAFIGSPIFDLPATSEDLKEARRVIAARRVAKKA